eukprot:TRINITY_DN51956_c0_g1_i5.p1 TRINITY_DN51956_c0_g1~~TRINITY_DN51956_c0_g1_i5.p1  ORF type:complete len:536 (+),score=32.09 TRINITY_DN51956_c0_g1_i5:248-1855(+)
MRSTLICTKCRASVVIRNCYRVQQDKYQRMKRRNIQKFKNIVLDHPDVHRPNKRVLERNPKRTYEDFLESFQKTSPKKLLKNIKFNWEDMDASCVETASRSLLHFVHHQSEYKRQHILTTYEVLLLLFNIHVNNMTLDQTVTCLKCLASVTEISGIRDLLTMFNQTFQILSNRVISQLDQMTQMQVVSVLESFAKTEYKYVKYIIKVSRQAAIIAVEKFYSEEEIATALWAMSVLGVNNLEIISRFVNQATRKIISFNSDQISKLTQGLVQLRYRDMALLARIEKLIIENQFEFTSLEAINNVTRAFAEFGILQKEPILQSLVQQFTDQKEFCAKQYAIFIYSLSLLYAPIELTQLVADQLGIRISSALKQTSLQSYNFCELRYSQMLYEARRERLNLLECIVNRSIRETREAIEKSSRETKYPFFKDLIRQIQLQYPYSKLNGLIRNDEVRLQIQIVGKYVKVAIEVISKEQFTINEPKQLMGSQIVRNDFLKWMGYKPIMVEKEKWNSFDYKKEVLDQLHENINPSRKNVENQ